MPPILTIAQNERRRHKRLPWRVKLTALSFIDGQQRRLETFEGVDISYSGLGVISPHPCEPGRQMVVALPRENGQCSYVSAKVVRCYPQGRHCRLGLIFEADAMGDGPRGGSAA
jgi:hypothetical protein